MFLLLWTLDLKSCRLDHVFFGEDIVTDYLILRHRVVSLVDLVVEICLDLAVLRLSSEA